MARNPIALDGDYSVRVSLEWAFPARPSLFNRRESARVIGAARSSIGISGLLGYQIFAQTPEKDPEGRAFRQRDQSLSLVDSDCLCITARRICDTCVPSFFPITSTSGPSVLFLSPVIGKLTLRTRFCGGSFLTLVRGGLQSIRN